jgi:DNA-binding MarR family transcriptional regulator
MTLRPEDRRRELLELLDKARHVLKLLIAIESCMASVGDLREFRPERGHKGYALAGWLEIAAGPAIEVLE